MSARSYALHSVCPQLFFVFSQSLMDILFLLPYLSDRYKCVPYPSHRLRFLELQLELIGDFRIRLSQVMKEEQKSPTEPVFCAVLNTVSYIIDILNEWSELPVGISFTVLLHC